jgi:hypothetical protein
VLWCDSDDILCKNALTKMLEIWSTVNESECDQFIGVIALCADKTGRIQSSGPSDFSPLICRWSELADLHGMSGDMCIMQSRHQVGNARFPEHDLVMNESGFWHQFMNLKVICISDVLKIMCRDTENRISGSPRMEYCRGKAYSIIYADSKNFSNYKPKKQINIASRYHRYSIHGDLPWKERNKKFLGLKTIWYYIGAIPGYALAFKDMMQRKVVKTHLIFEKGKNSIYTISRNSQAEKLWHGQH